MSGRLRNLISRYGMGVTAVLTPFVMTALCAPADYKGILLTFPIFLIAGCVVYMAARSLRRRGLLCLGKLEISLAAPLSGLYAAEFYYQWMYTGEHYGLPALAASVGMTVGALVLMTSAILCVLGFISLSYILAVLFSLYRSGRDKYLTLPGGSPGDLVRQRISGIIKKWAPIAAIILIEYTELYYSALYSLRVYRAGAVLLLFNLAVVAALNLLISIPLGSARRTLLVSFLIITLWSIADVYVIKYHGTPLFMSELKNVGAAAEVMGSYKFSLNPGVIGVVAILWIGLILMRFVPGEPLMAEMRPLISILCRGVLIVISFAAVWAYVDSKKSLLYSNWEGSIRVYGFMLCMGDDFVHMFPGNDYTEPYGYDVSLIREVEIPDGTVTGDYPDIILILNETLFDLGIYTDIGADSDYLSDLYGIPHAVYGYAAEPSIGGGTNNSEFELLTSKSMYLMGSISAPFNYVDFTRATSSVTEYLKALGYEASAMHSAPGRNYKRNVAYPALGFETIFFADDGFFHEEDNGNRPWTDLSNYRDLIGYYETLTDTPEFIYMLTYQNHGGYEQNESELDTVHATKDLGDLTEQVNEYLSSVTLSASAFKELTAYFDRADRPVIICMVGDHAPSFIGQLPIRPGLSESKATIYERFVPYVIWSNYDADLSGCAEYVSMTDLVPMVARAAGLPMSDFYETILDLSEELPVRTSDGLLMDSGGRVSVYDEESDDYDLLRQYYYKEYNSLIGGDDYLSGLFLPAALGTAP